MEVVRRQARRELGVIRRRRLPVWPLLDAATPALALGYAVGRIGCFLVGDDYGRPTDAPWGIAFANGLPPTTAGYLRADFGLSIPPGTPDDALLRVHPTQLYETAIALGIFAVGYRLLRRGGAPVPGNTALATGAFTDYTRLPPGFWSRIADGSLDVAGKDFA